jgi:hypothetical protein
MRRKREVYDEQAPSLALNGNRLVTLSPLMIVISEK